MEERSKSLLGQVLRIAKGLEADVRRGWVVVRFLARRMLHAAVQDSDMHLAMACYLPELQERLTQAQVTGRLEISQVASFPLYAKHVYKA